MKIAIIGLGIVGRGVYDIIQSEPSSSVSVKYVMDIRRVEGVTCEYASSIEQIVKDKEIELVVEAIGGLHPAYECVSAALKAGKHCVTPNKQLISSMYPELTELARKNGVSLRFTAAAGGGIPWLYNLKRTKRCSSISSLCGIINGTTNFILDSMAKTGGSFDDILKQAQQLGYAEANPSADIDGIDLQRKCAISANIAFNAQIAPEQVDTMGIRYITAESIQCFAAMGRVCKLMCQAKRGSDNRIAAYVEPELFSLDDLEANVVGNNNFVSLEGEYVGRLSFYGQGAGRYPTAHSLVEDILDVQRGNIDNAESVSDIEVDNNSVAERYFVDASDYDFLNGITLERLGNGVVTEEITVSQMHQRAAKQLSEGKRVFFAAIRL